MAYPADILARLGSIIQPKPYSADQEYAAPLIHLAAFYSIFAGAIALALCLIRQPLGGPGAGVFLFYWLEVSALLGIVALTAGARYRTDHYLRWFLVALVIFLAAGVFPALAALVLASTAGIALLMLIAAARSGRTRPLLMGATGLASLCLAACYFLQVNSMGYGSVFLPEFVLAGVSFPDTLFHTSLSATIAWYGRIASDLDGLVPIRYHIFSHLWFGLTAKAAGINVVNGYYIAVQVIGLPLLLFGLAFAVSGTASPRRPESGAALLITVPIALLVVVDRFDWMSYLVSESYMVSLLLLLIGLPLLRSLANAGSYPLPSVATALIYGMLLSTAKISTGAVWTVPLAYLLVRGNGLSKLGYAVAIVLLVLQAAIVFKFTLPNDNIASTSFDPLHFLRSYPTVALANLLPISLAAILRLRDLRCGNERQWSEVVLLMLFITVAPSLLLRIEGGSAYYIINIGTWLAIADLSGRLIARITPRTSVAATASAIAVIAAGTFLHPEKSNAYNRLKHSRDALYEKLEPTDKTGATGSRLLFGREALKALAARSAQSTGAKIGRLLDEVHVSAGADALVTIAPEFRAYWMLTPQCNASPFLIPSFFGLPMLKGLPPQAETCDLGAYYGYGLYGASSHSSEIDEAYFCRLTRDKGFANLVIIRSEQQVKKLDCSVQ